MSNPLIELEGVTRYYKMGEPVVKAIDGINISIDKGDFVVIMGPSGSGKSTAMNLVGSLDLATQGRILLEGSNIEEFGESELAQLRGKKIGFIFQSFNLIPNLTAKENVMLPMMFQKVDKADREERSEKLLKLVELEDRMNHYPNQLSGGQQQRVAIARALANDPEIILADEPTGNLDTKTGEHVMNLLTSLNEQGKTIILITHASEVAIKRAKKIYWLKDGKIEKLSVRKGNAWITKKELLLDTNKIF
ncbi:MAG: ABC transporter ATP-binding protein [Nanoarchaeota archaeon]